MVVGLGLAPLALAKGKVEDQEVSSKVKKLAELDRVALVSVYGTGRVKGVRFKAMDSPPAALEGFLETKVESLHTRALAEGFVPVDVLDEGSVLNSEAYPALIGLSLSKVDSPTGDNLLAGIGQAIGAVADAASGADAVEISARAGYPAAGYGIYGIDHATDSVIMGTTTDEREGLMQQLDAQAVLSVEIHVSAIGSGGVVLGKEKGQVLVDLWVTIEQANSSKPLEIWVQGASSKQVLFRANNAGIFNADRDLVDEAAVELAEEAWAAALDGLTKQMTKVEGKVDKQRAKM
jgi:hypothetical protein